MEEVVLVNEQDQPVGTMEKMAAHQQGLLHRAFSLLIYNNRGDMLLQKRASTKYHSGGLWSNACCSHPRPGETVKDAVERKLLQEMGMKAEIHFSHTFIYHVNFGGLIEHELDHVFTATTDTKPVLNPMEVEDWKYISMVELQRDLIDHPERYSFWFHLIMKHRTPR